MRNKFKEKKYSKVSVKKGNRKTEKIVESIKNYSVHLKTCFI